MKSLSYKNGLILALILSFGLNGCAGSNSGSDSVNNEHNNWSISSGNGYSGGDVIFGNLKIVGEWQTQLQTTNNSTAKDPFDHTYNNVHDYLKLSVGFGSYGQYYEYWYKYGGSSGWTPISDYEVSQDGQDLTIGLNHFHYISSPYNKCIIVKHIESTNEYLICKTSDTSPE